MKTKETSDLLDLFGIILALTYGILRQKIYGSPFNNLIQWLFFIFWAINVFPDSIIEKIKSLIKGE